MSEETDSPLAARAVLARLSPVTGRVEPALENSMSELARVAFLAVTFSEIGAGRTRIVELPRVAAPGLLSRVGERTVSPVMRPATCAPPHLELEHPEMVAGVGINRRIRVQTRNLGVRVRVRNLVGGQVALESRQGFVEVVRAVCIAVRADGDAAQRVGRVHLRRWIVEAQPRRDVDRRVRTVRFSEHHFVSVSVSVGGGIWTVVFRGTIARVALYINCLTSGS